MPAKKAYLYLIIIIIFNKQFLMPPEERNKWELSTVDIKALHKKCVYWITSTELSILLYRKSKKERKKKTHKKTKNEEVSWNE